MFICISSYSTYTNELIKKEHFNNGVLIEIHYFTNNILNYIKYYNYNHSIYKIIYYYENGQKKKIEFMKNNKIINTQYFHKLNLLSPKLISPLVKIIPFGSHEFSIL